MMHRVTLDPVYVLHTRPYSNTSLIVDLLTMTHGRVSVVARSARGLKSRYRGMLQLFSPLLASWVGRSELKSLGNIERNGAVCQVEGQSLVCSFYLNELLMRLLQRDDPCVNIYHLYKSTLGGFEKKNDLRSTLRYFEKNLLKELGYALPLNRDANTGLPLNPEFQYYYSPERGFLRSHNVEDRSPEGHNSQAHNSLEKAGIYSGRSLLALHQDCLDNDAVLQDAKRLLRTALLRHLGNKPIKSRELFSDVAIPG